MRSCSISDGEWADVPEDQEKMKLKEKIFNIIQIGDKSNPISRMFDIFITVTIVANILVTFLQTFDELAFLTTVFKGVEYVTIFFVWNIFFVYGRLNICIRTKAGGVRDSVSWCRLMELWISLQSFRYFSFPDL